MCPLSNLRLNVVDDLRDLPIRRYLDAGVVVTVNSDDPAYFGGYVNDNLHAVAAATGLTARHAYQLAANSFEASFADAAAKARWREQLGACFERFGR